MTQSLKPLNCRIFQEPTGCGHTINLLRQKTISTAKTTVLEQTVFTLSTLNRGIKIFSIVLLADLSLF